HHGRASAGVGRGSGRVAAADGGSDGLGQFGFAEGLGEVALRALAQAPDAVGFLVLGSDQDHRDVASLRVALDRTGGLEPVEVRRSEEHTSELQSREKLVCRLLLEKKNK